MDVGIGGYPTRRLGPYPSFGMLGGFDFFGIGLGADPAGVTFLGDRLLPNKVLKPNQGLKSKNGRVQVILQASDGNCVLYGDGNPLWWTGPAAGVTQASMQADGNFVVYAGAQALWASDTSGHPGTFLLAQDDGNLVAYWGDKGSALWSSETSGFRYYGGPGTPISLSDIVSVAGDVLSVAEVVVSFVPVVGTGINAAIAAGAALARGENISEAVAEGVKNSLPGGPVAAAAFDAAVAAGKAIASGQNIGDAALAATRAALPSEEAKRAFDVGLAVAHGQNVQAAMVAVVKTLAPDAAQAASSLLKQPELLNLPVAQVANLLHTSPAAVTAATTALHSNPILAPPPTTHKSPVLHAAKPPPPGPNPKLVSSLAAVARKSPTAKDAEVLYIAVAADHDLVANANTLSPKLISNMIAVARHFPNAKDAEVFYIASLPPNKTPVLKAATPPTVPAPVVVASGAKPMPSAPGHNAYGPYPSAGTVSAPPHPHGGHHGPSVRRGHFGPIRRFAPWETEIVETVVSCRTWGAPVDGMQAAAMAALGASGMRPTTARGPDGTLYLFTLENGAATARPCVATG